VVVPLDAGWSDVGSWSALHEVRTKNDQDNVCIGDVVLEDSAHCYVHSTNRLVAGIGLDHHCVVETKDAVLIAPLDRVQDVKKIVDRLKSQGREEAESHCKVFRPWGNYEGIDLGDRYQVKRITVYPGQILSLQKHFHRSEHWILVKGTALVTRGDDEIMLVEDQSTYIPLGTIHRLENPGKVDLELIEIQTGSYLGEDDIVRLEDVYGRDKKK
jgi:mannose-1-phosphate guanylyltransferase/mannose-6-phosphate isomerase